jgi:predicted acylesterase/phospholipase RssA
MDSQIKAIFGVSAGAIIGAYRAAGYPARKSYEHFSDLFSF